MRAGYDERQLSGQPKSTSARQACRHQTPRRAEATRAQEDVLNWVSHSMRWLPVPLLLACSAVALPAAAQQVPFVMAMESTPCRGEAEFTDRLVHRAPFLRYAAIGEAALRYSVTVVATPRGYAGQLSIAEPGGQLTTRSIEGETCAGVVDALALVAAVLAEQQLPPPAPPTPGPPRESPPSGEGPPSPPRTASWSAGFAFSLGISTAAGPRALVGPGADLVLSSQRGSLWAPSFWVGALSRRSTRISNPEGDAVFEGWALRVVASPLRWPTRGAVGLHPALGLEVGRLAAQGENTFQPDSTTVPWVTPGAWVLGEARWLGPLAVTAEVGVLFPLVRDGFYFDSPAGPRTVFEVDRVGWAARWGLVVLVP